MYLPATASNGTDPSLDAVDHRGSSALPERFVVVVTTVVVVTNRPGSIHTLVCFVRVFGAGGARRVHGNATPGARRVFVGDGGGEWRRRVMSLAGGAPAGGRREGSGSDGASASAEIIDAAVTSASASASSRGRRRGEGDDGERDGSGRPRRSASAPSDRAATSSLRASRSSFARSLRKIAIWCFRRFTIQLTSAPARRVLSRASDAALRSFSSSHRRTIGDARRHARVSSLAAVISAPAPPRSPKDASASAPSAVDDAIVRGGADDEETETEEDRARRGGRVEARASLDLETADDGEMERRAGATTRDGRASLSPSPSPSPSAAPTRSSARVSDAISSALGAAVEATESADGDEC